MICINTGAIALAEAALLALEMCVDFEFPEKSHVGFTSMIHSATW